MNEDDKPITAIGETPAQVRSEFVGKQLQRGLTIDATRAIDADKRTVELSFSSETPYERWFGFEILGHKKSEVKLDRLNESGCVLIDHKGDQIGTVDKAWIADGKCRAVLRFSRSARGAEVFQDIVDGIRKNVSVGYMIHEIKLVSEANGVRTYRATDWEPYEVSMVGIPADTGVGVGRSAAPATPPSPSPVPNPKTPAASAEPHKTQRSSITMEGTHTPDPAAVQRQLVETQKATSANAAEIVDIGTKHNCMELAVKALRDGISVAEFKGIVLEKQGLIKPVTTDPTIGMNQKEVRSYSLMKAIREACAPTGLTGLEKEAHEATAKLAQRSAQGFFVPFDVQVARSGADSQAIAALRSMIRGLQATVASTGGYTVGTDVLGASMIEILNNMTVLNQLGARTLSGLQGDVAIPRVSGGATVYWLAEGVAVTPSTQAFQSVGLKPKRVAAQTAFSKQLLAQSSIDVEGFVRSDLMERLAIEKDRVGIRGTGAGGEPIGIVNTSGVNTVTFGAAPTWAKVVSFETKVAEDNALLGALAYLTTPGVKGTWKTTTKVSNTASFLWGENNQVNGYPAVATNQVASDRVIYGNFRDLLFGDWAGMDVVVDPYTRAGYGEILVTVQMLMDVAIRHAESFCVSTDAGNQA